MSKRIWTEEKREKEGSGNYAESMAMRWDPKAKREDGEQKKERRCGQDLVVVESPESLRIWQVRNNWGAPGFASELRRLQQLARCFKYFIQGLCLLASLPGVLCQPGNCSLARSL
jgi:hypothetical protein